MPIFGVQNFTLNQYLGLWITTWTKIQYFGSTNLKKGRIQTGKFAECAGNLSYIQISCTAVFVSLNNSSIVYFCCFMKILQLEPWLKFKVDGREIGYARQTFQSGEESWNLRRISKVLDSIFGVLKTLVIHNI